MKDHDVVDAEVLATAQLQPLEADTSVAANVQPTISREQMARFLEAMQRKHNSQCRKPGFTGHFHQPAGSKITRALAKDGSVYGPRSIVQQAFDTIRNQKWEASGKAAKYAEVGAQKAAVKAAKKLQNSSAVSA